MYLSRGVPSQGPFRGPGAFRVILPFMGPGAFRVILPFMGPGAFRVILPFMGPGAFRVILPSLPSPSKFEAKNKKNLETK